jgi:hypothetical protein
MYTYTHTHTQHINTHGSERSPLKQQTNQLAGESAPKQAATPNNPKLLPVTSMSGYENGYVFGCNSSTYSECIERKLFGNAQAQWFKVRDIRVGGTALFLFNYTTRKLQGLFVAIHPPSINIEPTAWNSSRRRHGAGRVEDASSPYPAQVRVREVAKLVPLDEAEYRNVLTQTSLSDKNFSVELTAFKAKELIRLMLVKHFP